LPIARVPARGPAPPERRAADEAPGAEAGVTAVVTTSYPRGPGDHAGSFVAIQVAESQAAGERVLILAAGDAEVARAAGAPRPPARVGAPEVIRIPFAAPGVAPLFLGAGAPEAIERHPAAAVVQALRFWGGLVAALRAEGPRIARVESHWLVPSSLAAASVLPMLPHRAHAHGGDVALLERLPGGASVARLLARRIEQIVFASGELEARFVRLLAGVRPNARLLVQPAPVDLACFGVIPEAVRRELRRDLGLAEPTVLGVGRLVPIKGWDVLIRAVGRLPAEQRPRVALAGDGPEREALEALAVSRGVTLRLLGFVPPPELARWMAAADVVAQPSRRLGNGRTEGTPLALREALSCGRPVIASATGGIPALANSAPGLRLVPPEDPAALCVALAAALRPVE
jgi:glycosyltransferase involved in cell wall biosynthesis